MALMTRVGARRGSKYTQLSIGSRSRVLTTDVVVVDGLD